MQKIPSRDVIEKFWRCVDKKDDNSCWAWIAGTKGEPGYGDFRAGGKRYSAHRLSYLISNGPIPAGMSVLHSCDNRRCVNPRHLRCGTQKENIQDMIRRNRQGFGAPAKWVWGEKHPRSKLNEEIVKKIRTDERTLAKIAESYNISQSLVFGIKRRKTWKHVD